MEWILYTAWTINQMATRQAHFCISSSQWFLKEKEEQKFSYLHSPSFLPHILCAFSLWRRFFSQLFFFPWMSDPNKKRSERTEKGDLRTEQKDEKETVSIWIGPLKLYSVWQKRVRERERQWVSLSSSCTVVYHWFLEQTKIREKIRKGKKRRKVERNWKNFELKMKLRGKEQALEGEKMKSIKTIFLAFCTLTFCTLSRSYKNRSTRSRGEMII